MCTHPYIFWQLTILLWPCQNCAPGCPILAYLELGYSCYCYSEHPDSPRVRRAHCVQILVFWYCRSCLCTGCKTMSTQAIRLAYFHTSRLFSNVEKKRSRMISTHKLVGASLARVLHAQICLLLQSHAPQSMTHSVLLQAQLCSQASRYLHA